MHQRARTHEAESHGDDAKSLGSSLLADLVRTSRDGVAVLDADHRYIYVNPAGCELLGKPLRALLGKTAPFLGMQQIADPSTAPGPPEPGVGFLVITSPDGYEREIEYVESRLATEAGDLMAVTFRDITDSRRHERRLTAFARTASTIAYAGSLQSALDDLAAEVVQASGLIACTVVLIDPVTHSIRQVGTSGYPRDYADLLQECWRLGAPLLTTRVFETRQPVVAPTWKEAVLADSRWAPMHDMLRDSHWGPFVAFPLITREVALGALTGYYAEGDDPQEADIRFVRAMADQAAVAVQMARLLAEKEDSAAQEERHRLARELHDSVCQALFSMTLHTRALELAAQHEGRGADDRFIRGLAELRGLTQGALAEMRALIFQSRPHALHEEGLLSAIRQHAEAVAARAGLNLHIEATENVLLLEEDAERELFRVVQEALHNVVKHANATRVHIRIGPRAGEPETLVIEVTDDGVGFDTTANHPGHLGLTSMRERTERLGGRLSIISTRGDSTTVRAVLPSILRELQVTGSDGPASGEVKKEEAVS